MIRMRTGRARQGPRAVNLSAVGRDGGKRKRSRRSLWALALLLPLCAIVLLAGVMAVLLSAAATSDVRRVLVEEALERSLGQDMRVRGALEFGLGSDITIAVAGPNRRSVSVLVMEGRTCAITLASA